MTNKIKLSVIIPLIIFGLLVAFLWRGLSLDPHRLPSTLINKPLPEFVLPNLLNASQTLTTKNLTGQVALINVWATWCGACRAEHKVLMDIALQNIVAIYGLDYKDEQQQALEWLKQYGNPYAAIAFDQQGLVGINWGVYGTPETFVIDKHGVIRDKEIGPLTQKLWQEKLLPLVQQLQKESS